ncbi:hypothetical protein Bca52824_033631 [Brassica carinata]|uniref:Uncharacterized protein n=1 Tax=Brassica carinata TaxID=52824 RepID=A0A8X7V692_BRACI|nr:hypothetical protein Bca52824_033631 [Brassica carinata]
MLIGGQSGEDGVEEFFSENPSSEQPGATDANLNDIVVSPVSTQADMANEEDVMAGEHPEPKRNVDVEITFANNLRIYHTVQVDSVNPPPPITTETSMDASANIDKANQEASGSGLSFPVPSFSIGLTQLNKSNAEDVDHVVIENNEDEVLAEAAVDDEANVDNEDPIVNRKSKGAKVVPRHLVGDYLVDKRFLTRAWESYINAICSTPSIDYAAKFALLLEILDGTPFVIDFGGVTVESRELSAIVDRSSHLPAKCDNLFVFCFADGAMSM